MIIVCGFAGSGKSTLTDSLAKKLGWKAVHASDILRQIKTKKMEEIDLEHTKAGKGYWETDSAMQYNKERLKNMNWDKLVNQKLYELVEEGNAVFDSWTLPWLSKHGLKIWLKVSFETRAKRLGERDGMSTNEAKQKIVQKEKETTQIFKKTFGFEFGKDLEPFHAILDTDMFEANEVLEMAHFIAKIYLKKLE